MARNRNFKGRASRGVKNQIWTSALLNEAVTGTLGQLEVNLVQASDWSLTEGERGTVMTIRGWLSISTDNDAAASKNEGSIHGYIGVVSDIVAAGSAPSPILPATYTSPSILTTFGFLWAAVAPGDHRNSQMWEINVKTKRTIRADQQIRMVIFNSLDDTINTSLVVRTLMRKGN